MLVLFTLNELIMSCFNLASHRLYSCIFGMHQKRDLFSAESRAQGAFPAVKQAMCPAHAISDGQNVATLETICMADGPDRNGFSMHPKI